MQANDGIDPPYEVTHTPSFPEDVPMKEAVTRALIKGLIELVGG
jgi:hypothetical protein